MLTILGGFYLPRKILRKEGKHNMKLAFSTLCCPNYDWKDIFTMAKDLGFEGIEVRHIREEESSSPKEKSFPEYTLTVVRLPELSIRCM